jgi:hypothetical protein
MGFRFRRSIRLLPGVRLNFSRSGVSTSLGVRGASVTVGRRGVRANVGLPGTGISYSTRLDEPSTPGARGDHPLPAATTASQIAAAIGILAIFGAGPALLAGG